MGSSTRSSPAKPAYDLKPKGRRVHLAGLVVEDMLKWTVEHVILDRNHLNQERECYEVSEQFREQKSWFLSIVRDHVPGSNPARSRGAMNKPTLADKIVMVFMDYVNREIIRPGPTPEDRNSHDIRDELHLTQTPLTGLIAEVISVEDKYEGLT